MTGRARWSQAMVGLLGVAIGVAWGAHASADPGPEKPWYLGTTEADREAARGYFHDAAHELAHRGDDERALEHLERALRRWDHPAVRAQLGWARVRLGAFAEGTMELWRAMRYEGRGLTLERVEAIERLERYLLTFELAHMVVRVEPAGRVQVGADVTVVGPGAWEGLVPHGSLTVVSSGPGGEARELIVAVAAGERLEVVVPPDGGEPGVRRSDRLWAELPSLQRRLVGHPVRYPDATQRSRWPTHSASAGRPPARVDPAPGPEAARLCAGAVGDLAAVCELYARDRAARAAALSEAGREHIESLERLARLINGDQDPLD